MVRLHAASPGLQPGVAPVYSVYAPSHDLVSYAASQGGILGVWAKGETGETLVRRASQGGIGWEEVSTQDMEHLAQAELEVGELEEPRQVYLEALLAPGAFLPSTLVKTLHILRRGASNTSMERELHSGQGQQRLRAEIVLAVENSVQALIGDTEVMCLDLSNL